MIQSYLSVYGGSYERTQGGAIGELELELSKRHHTTSPKRWLKKIFQLFECNFFRVNFGGPSPVTTVNGNTIFASDFGISFVGLLVFSYLLGVYYLWKYKKISTFMFSIGKKVTCLPKKSLFLFLSNHCPKD